jgi:hypothetical protein
MDDEQKKPEVIPIKPIERVPAKEDLYKPATDSRSTDEQEALSSIINTTDPGTAFLPRSYRIFLTVFLVAIVVIALAAGVWLFKDEISNF